MTLPLHLLFDVLEELFEVFKNSRLDLLFNTVFGLLFVDTLGTGSTAGISGRTGKNGSLSNSENIKIIRINKLKDWK